MKTLLVTFVLLAVLLISCVNGTVETENICSSKEYATIPGGLGGTRQSLSRSSNHDFYDALSKINTFGNVEVSLTEATLTSKEKLPLDFIDSFTLSIIKDDGSEEELGTAKSQSGTSITTSLKTSESTADALRKGPVRIKFASEASAPPKDFTPIFSICVSAKAKVNETLSNAFN